MEIGDVGSRARARRRRPRPRRVSLPIGRLAPRRSRAYAREEPPPPPEVVETGLLSGAPLARARPQRSWSTLRNVFQDRPRHARQLGDIDRDKESLVPR